jgi:two-component system sensor histidine kinase UhpB
MARMKRKRRDSLIGQILGVNVLLVTATIFAASLAAGLDLTIHDQRRQFLILAMAIVLTLLVNLAMLQRRFKPLERLIEQVEAIDPADPAPFETQGESAEEIARLTESFRRLLARIESERRRSGRLVVRAQEAERRRVARDLHDEANQALTAILLRLEALSAGLGADRAGEVAEVKRLANQAMEELLALARQLRPSALDDHGLVPAIDGQLKNFADQTGVEARLATHGSPASLHEDEQTAIYRIVQEALSNVSQHAGARRVEIELSAPNGTAPAGPTELRIEDDGRGFEPARIRDGTGLEGMAERARLIGGDLDVRSAPGRGTSLTLRIPER